MSREIEFNAERSQKASSEILAMIAGDKGDGLSDDIMPQDMIVALMAIAYEGAERLVGEDLATRFMEDVLTIVSMDESS